MQKKVELFVRFIHGEGFFSLSRKSTLAHQAYGGISPVRVQAISRKLSFPVIYIPTLYTHADGRYM